MSLFSIPKGTERNKVCLKHAYFFLKLKTYNLTNIIPVKNKNKISKIKKLAKKSFKQNFQKILPFF
jgi:hypothetical protein